MIFCKKFGCLIMLTTTILFVSSVIRVNAAASSNTKQDPKCLLPMEPGPCRMSLNRFYYNSKTDTCEEFKFGGCKGNDNKFGFKQTCEAACKKSATGTAATSSTTTTESTRYANKQLKSDTLKTLTTNVDALTSTTTTKPRSNMYHTTKTITSNNTQ